MHPPGNLAELPDNVPVTVKFFELRYQPLFVLNNFLGLYL
jgi:hypothetical protein